MKNYENIINLISTLRIIEIISKLRLTHKLKLTMLVYYERLFTKNYNSALIIFSCLKNISHFQTKREKCSENNFE